MMRPIWTGRTIIIGSGLAGLYTALNLSPWPSLVITAGQLGEGTSSAWAQGGVAAAIGDGDSPSLHSRDTSAAGAGLVDRSVAEFVSAEAHKHIEALHAMGTPFDMTAEGHYCLSREAGHDRARVVRVVGDRSGAGIMSALINQIRRTPSVQVLENVVAQKLMTRANRVIGLWVSQKRDCASQPVCLSGHAYVIAGGGSAGIFSKTTNPLGSFGQALGMAANAGARIADAEFVQFHPTAIKVDQDPSPLATEALRGEGAKLINRYGTRFMLHVHKDAELAPRDVVARAIFQQTQDGLGPMLDTRDALGKDILTKFPTVAKACLKAGIDPVARAIPVVAAAHYHMGGIATDLKGRSNLTGLWACGEASSTGLHGANRVASNSLLEALVFGSSCANDIKVTIGKIRHAPEVPAIEFLAGRSKIDSAALLQLRQIMNEHVGIVRSGAGLRDALRNIAEIEQMHESGGDAWRNITATATLIATAALRREESRGGHYRLDFQGQYPGPARRSFFTLNQAMALREKAIEYAEFGHRPLRERASDV